jgi:ribonuclease HII
MPFPNRRRERKLHRKGFAHVAGVDEAGKGSWAGAIVAGAVILDPKTKIKGIKDSKKLRAPDRAELFKRITANCIAWAVAAVDQKTIDRIGIVEANKKAMRDALAKLDPAPDYVITDAVQITFGDVPVKAVIKGDHKIRTVAAASIIAKVVRDKMMEALDDGFPEYGFKQHKGYGTNHHFHMIMRFGVSGAHRKTFEPMRSLLADAAK